jgi:hypothetical protein
MEPDLSQAHIGDTIYGESEFFNESSLLKGFLAYRGTGGHAGDGPGRTKGSF